MLKLKLKLKLKLEYARTYRAPHLSFKKVKKRKKVEIADKLVSVKFSFVKIIFFVDGIVDEVTSNTKHLSHHNTSHHNISRSYTAY